MWTRGRGQLGRMLVILVVVLLPGAAQAQKAHVPAATQAHRLAPTSPADLAIQFEALLGHHSILAADLMRGRIRGDDDLVQAANAALGRNTDAMVDLLTRLFGRSMANRFGPMWTEHVEELFAYAAALADHDAAARTHARTELTEYERDLGDFFAGASHGRLSVSAARTAVDEHVRHLTMQADRYVAGDYRAADRLYREGYQHTYDLGLALADALLPAQQRATLREPVWRLRSQLGKLLAEHAALVEDVTRAAVSNTPDFPAAGQMINGNTSDLTAAIDVLFGAAAAKQFQRLWGSHVEQLVAYSSATAAKDPQRQEQARAALGDFERQMTTFLAEATGNRLTSRQLAAALAEHDRMLLQHADAYGARDYPRAHDIAYGVYDHMFQLARTLADAFGSTVAGRLPRGGAQTGYGGQAAGH